MLKKGSLLIFILFQLSIYVFAQNVTQFLLSSKRKNIEGQQFFTAQTYLPISLNQVVGGGTVKFPPSILQYQYGVFQNISLGAMLGYSSSLSKTLDVGSAYSLLSTLQQELCNNDPELASILGINCSKNGQSLNYRTNYLLIGASAKYFIEAGDQLNVYAHVGLGYKAGSQKRISASTSIPLVDELIKTYNQASKFFVLTTLGTHVYVNQQKSFAVTAEGGYGYGLGDNIVIATQTIVVSLGCTYHLLGR